MDSKTQSAPAALDHALDDLQDLVDLGIKFVPSMPSPEMAEAGARAAGITKTEAIKVYLAMVEADALDDTDPGTAPN